MAHADPPSRSRVAWPHREPPESAGVVEIASHKCKSSRSQWAAIVALYVVVALNSYLQTVDHQFVLGRGQYRDAEDARMEQESIERLRLFACDLLDGLPAGPLLDPKRAQYGCGPGVPIDQLPPEAQRNLGELLTVQPPESTPTTQRPAPGTATPSAPAAESYDRKRPRLDPADETPAPAAPSPSPTLAAPTPQPAPLVDVSPLTDTVCDLLGICI
jgi:hypothetical protein